ncbi:MAG: electron transfer flavoprotein subunit alpha/FixB family protein [Bacteroidota bacterium]|nr:electron transfer flavoprotein subunit alpha/FixB family protein [Bacteroidota bacterium]
MSILIYAENWEGKVKKNIYEITSYAKELAKKENLNIIAVSTGDVEENELSTLSEYGINKILIGPSMMKADSKVIASFLETIVEEYNISLCVFADSYSSKMITARLAVKINASLINNVVELPITQNPFKVKRKTFSGKAFEIREANRDKVILTISQNAFGIQKNPIECEIEKVNYTNSINNISVIKTEKSSGKINLSEAEIIVSAGRGLKGPENWNIVEELAEVLNAATACSKPVSDSGWRPHSEHVGQTGKTVAPNLYIAIGISGAIQHLAGVNSSKTMVVINTDSEAPFFKAADYGIVGDAFEVLPKLTEAIRNFKS